MYLKQLSNFVSDATLKKLHPLPKLEHLHLIGCPKVTQDGVMAVINANITGIISLGLEGLSPQFVCACCILSFID